MRKVTREVVSAFVNGKAKTVKNTMTDGRHIWLHGNLIALRTGEGTYLVSLAGWNTATTRDRVNGVLDALDAGMRICTKKDVPHIYSHRSGAKFPISSTEFIQVTPGG